MAVTEKNSTADKLNERAWVLRYSDSLQAEQLALQALQLSESVLYEKGMAFSRLTIAVCSFLLSKTGASLLRDLNYSLHYFERNQELIGQVRTLNCLGNVYDSFGEYERGLNACLGGIPIAERMGFKEELGDTLSTLGNIYSRLADYDQALQSYQKSLQIREELKGSRAIASSMNLIARTYTSKSDFENGLLYYQKSFQLREKINDPALSWTLLGLASLHEKKGDFSRSLEYYLECKKRNDVVKDKRLELHCLLGISRYYIREKDTDATQDFLLTALKIAREIQAKPLLYEVHALLAELFEIRKDQGKALDHFKLFHALKEEVLNSESANRLKNQQISFAIERSEKEAEIERLRNVELKAAHDKIEEKNRDITASINYALRIQSAMLPDRKEINECLPESFILFKPKDIVSGDFYWFVKTESRIFIAVADCTGHGVPGALMSMLGTEKLNDAIKASGDVSAILNRVNREMKKALRQKGKEEDTRDGMDIALCSVEFSESPVKRILHYSGANRPLWILRKGQIEPVEIKATKTAIGGYTEDNQHFERHTIELQKGDAFYIFSDGFADQFGGEQGKKMSTKRLKEYLSGLQNNSMKEQLEKLTSYFTAWKGSNEQVDDVLLIGVRV